MNNSNRRDFVKKLAIAATGTSGMMMSTPSIFFKSSNLEDKKTESGENDKPKKGGINCDVVVYGGTSAGVIAAYTAGMYGLHVVLVEPGRHLGGLTAGGLGATDTGGHEDFITGLAKEFYLRIGRYYGKSGPMYKFEPHVAESIFNQYINEANIEVLYSRRVRDVKVKNSRITSVNLEYSPDNSDVISLNAKIFIDTSYEGDLMAGAGVSYTVGRESNKEYNERFNGVILPRKKGPYFGTIKTTKAWKADIDPYVVPGKPSSGLLPEINGIGHKPIGSGDISVQAYCFRMCLTQDKKNQLPFEEPKNYNPGTFELLARYLKKRMWKSLEDEFNIAVMPRGKTDWNNDGLAGLSTDYIGKNFAYPDGSYEERSRIWNDHIEYQKSLLWFVANDQRVPSHIRKEMNSWGYCRDEFLDTNGWPHQLYVREARRMIGDFVMTEHECVGKNPVKDGIAYGIYALDSHDCQRIVVDNHVVNEGNTFIYGFPPYLISYRSLVPKRDEALNLLVPACLSASHSAFSSIRMEPVFMELGQVAGIAAYLAVKKDQDVQHVDADIIKKELSENPLSNGKVPGEYSNILAFKIH